jgi:hypothetical protein
MHVEIETVLAREDYDAALNPPSRPMQLFAFLLLSVGALWMFWMVGSSFSLVAVKSLSVLQDPVAQENLLRSGDLYWLVPMLLLTAASSVWFLLFIFRSWRHHWRMLRKPKDFRIFRAGVHVGPAKFVLSPTGFLVRTQHTRRLLPWTAFATVEDARGCLHFPYAASDGKERPTGLFIPAHAFASDAERLDATRFAMAQIQGARK